MFNIFDELEKISTVVDQKTGEEKTLRGHSFKYLGLYFTATWCTYCVQIVDKMPKMIERVNHGGEHLKLLTLRLDETPNNFAYSYLRFKSIAYDLAANIASQLGVRNIPSILVYNLAGQLVSSNGLRDIMQHQ